jgi:hypothetical protein
MVRNISNIGQPEDADAILAAPESFSTEFHGLLAQLWPVLLLLDIVATAGIRATSKAGIERVGEVGFVISVLLVLVIMCFEHWH